MQMTRRQFLKTVAAGTVVLGAPLALLKAAQALRLVEPDFSPDQVLLRMNLVSTFDFCKATESRLPFEIDAPWASRDIRVADIYFPDERTMILRDVTFEVEKACDVAGIALRDPRSNSLLRSAPFNPFDYARGCPLLTADTLTVRYTASMEPAA